MYMVQMLTIADCLYIHLIGRWLDRNGIEVCIILILLVLSNSQLLKVHCILHSKLMFNFSQQLHM